MDDGADDKPHYLGHRQRLRERFMAGGADALPDYELLELLLFQARPRGDVKPLAKALKTVQAAALRMAKQDLLDRPVINSWKKLIDYCHASMAYEKIEQFRLLFLDGKNALIAEEVQQRGTVNHTPVYVREVVKRALELGASAIVMVHNHPSGDPAPSKDDIAMTREVAAAADKLGIVLHDHLIIGRKGHASLKSMGLI